MSTVLEEPPGTRGRRSSRFKRVVISERNYLALKRLGYAGDSFNDVISKLIRIEENYQEMKKKQKEQQQESIDDNSSNNSSNKGLLFPPSPAQILNEQNSSQRLDELIRSLQSKRSRRNDQIAKQ